MFCQVQALCIGSQLLPYTSICLSIFTSVYLSILIRNLGGYLNLSEIYVNRGLIHSIIVYIPRAHGKKERKKERNICFFSKNFRWLLRSSSGVRVESDEENTIIITLMQALDCSVPLLIFFLLVHFFLSSLEYLT